MVTISKYPSWNPFPSPVTTPYVISRDSSAQTEHQKTHSPAWSQTMPTMSLRPYKNFSIKETRRVRTTRTGDTEKQEPTIAGQSTASSLYSKIIRPKEISVSSTASWCTITWNRHLFSRGYHWSLAEGWVTCAWMCWARAWLTMNRVKILRIRKENIRWPASTNTKVSIRITGIHRSWQH